MNVDRSMRSDPVLELARRGAVRLAFGGGLLLTAVSAIQIISGESSGAETLVASLLTVCASTVMLRQERPNVIALLLFIAVVAVGFEAYAASQHATEYLAGIGSEVVVFGLGLLAVFIARERPRIVAAGFLLAAIVIVAIAQVGLNGWTLEIVSDSVVVVAVLGTVMYLVIKVLDSLAISQSRYSDLASVIPVATFEFDISRLMTSIGTLAQGPEEPQPVDEYLLTLVPLVRLSYTNRTADAMAESFGVWDEFVAGPNVVRVREVAASMIGALVAGKTDGSGEVTFTRVDGSDRDYVYHWSLARVAGLSAPHRFVLAATDVTRLRQAEHELERQLREREQFVASVSHELRTPLTSIMGLTEELVNRPGDFDAAERAELLGIVASETRDVVDIVEDLLVTARAEAGQLAMNLELCELGAEAERVGDLLGGVSTTAAPVWTRADPGRLRQVLRNLVSNAHRHGGEDVRIVVRRESRWAVAEVRDSGDALPPEVRERIFEPYQRANALGPIGSVGLGLHVARVLARLMGGDLSYRHDGAEAVFRLELPVSDEHLDVGVGGEIEERSGTGDVATLDQI
jgi:signal transduction histidine kinase